METGPIIGIIIFIVIILAIGIYFLLRYLKGNIKIEISEGKFNSGDTLSGKLNLKLKKETESNVLLISLLGTKKVIGTNNEGKRVTKNEIVYSQDINLEAARNYPSGFSNSYGFSFNIPYRNQILGPTVMHMNLNDVSMSGLGRSAIAARGAGRINWKLVGKLDAKGIDLISNKKVFIGLNDTQENSNNANVMSDGQTNINNTNNHNSVNLTNNNNYQTNINQNQ